MDAVLRDLRYAVRSLRTSPAFALVSILTLALGIGANSVIFTLENAVLLRPMPYPDPDRIFAFMSTFKQDAFERGSPAKFAAWQEFGDAFVDISAYRFTAINLSGGDAAAEQIPTGQVTASFFHLFGAAPILGRVFTEDEDRPGAGDVVVLSHGFWSRRFGADPAIVGKRLLLGGAPHTVVGVLSPLFEMPEVVPAPDVWIPFGLAPNSTEQGHILWGVGRLKNGRSLGEAQAELNAAADAFRHKFPDQMPRDGGFGVERYQTVVTRDVTPALVVLAGAVAFVLLIACANVANLLLVRATGRRREIAIRAAIGAGRAQVVRQLLTESVLLAIAGGALGLVLGRASIRALLALKPAVLPRVDPSGAALALDWRVLAFTAVLSCGTGILFGLFPALRITRTDLHTTLKDASLRAGGTARDHRARAVLVAAQLALALVLLVGSALLVRTFLALGRVDPGFASDHVLTLRMALTGPRFAATDDVTVLIRNGSERLRALPGVVAAATTCCLPLEGKYGHLAFDVLGRPVANGHTGVSGWVTASPGYFGVFRIPIVRGRAFTEQDIATNPPTVIISESFARRYWPHDDPLGARLLFGQGMGPQIADVPRQVVGIVGDVRESLDVDPFPTAYIPAAQVPDAFNRLLNERSPLGWVVRTTGDPRTFANAIKDELRRASGDMPIATVRSMDELRGSSTASATFNMVLLTTFGGVAIVLAAIGIYGLMAYAVQQRVQEMGVRLALGATPADVRNLIVRQGMAVVLVGIIVGLISAAALSRALASVVFGVSTHDPVAFAAITVGLLAIGLFGVWLPARRAARVDPLVALRAE